MAPSTSLIAALERLGPHDHLCSIYGNQEECFAIASPFVRIGLDRGEKCIYITDDDGTAADFRDALRAEGIDVGSALASKALVLTTKEQTYLKHGSFDSDWMLTFWKEATTLAVSEGFSALRVTDQSEWASRGGRGLERWMEYESRLTETLVESNCLALCQYNRQHCPPKCIVDVIRTHPIVIYGSTVCQNFYYVPLEEFLGTNQPTREVERLLTDLLERDRARKALRESEQRFRLMIEGVKDSAIFLLDTEGRVTSWNAEAERIKGYREEEILGEHFSRFYPPEEVAQGRPEQLLALAAATGRVEQEGWRQRKDGTRFWADTAITAIRNEEGELIGFSKVTRDLTAHKRAEEELRRGEAHLAEAQRLSHTGSWAWSVSAGIRFCSQEHLRIWGFDPETTKEPPTAQMFRQRIHPEDRPHVEQRFDRAVREKSSFEHEYRIVLPDGSIKYLLSLAYPVVNDSGDLVEFVGTVMDVTEQHQARAALEKAFGEINILKDRLYHENVALREEIDRTWMFEEIVGSSRTLKSVLSRVAKVAPTDSTVMITGETGTGKELIARAIHKRSKRAGRPFVGFNCAGIPPTLIASELFGHEKGAFTGAQRRRIGRFELAEGGTIFLDEIGELPAETQISLLRVIQEREFERVGGSQPIATDVRVIAASNHDLQAAVAAGTFRLDLFYRLNVFPIEVPPLRERKDDIPMLLEYFIKRYAGKAGKKIRSIDKKTVELFKSYHWPGNIRELQNVIERSVIVCESEILSVDESWLSKASLQPGRSSSNLSEKLLEEEKKIIESALSESKGRVSGRSGAAAKLGIPSSTLESKIKTLKIKKNRFK